MSIRRSIYNKVFILVCTLSFFIILSIFLLLLSNLFIEGSKNFIVYKIRLPIKISDYQDQLNSKDIISIIKDKTRQGLTKRGIDTSNVDIKNILNFNSLLDQNYKINKNQSNRLWVNVDKSLETYLKSEQKNLYINKSTTRLVQSLIDEKIIDSFYNFDFFKDNDSSDPQNAGIGQALKGSMYAILMAISISFPLGLFTAVFVNFYVPQAWRKLLLAHIKNLASLPSVIYGVIGLYFFINILQLPRSSTIVAALTLSLLATPIIFVITSSAFDRVEKSQIEASYAIGMSRFQVIFLQIIPQSLGTIITGIILTVSRIFGETAPLMMIGMIAFVSSASKDVYEPSTTLPVQIYSWINNPDPLFVSKSSLGIICLLLIILILNLTASIFKKYLNQQRS